MPFIVSLNDKPRLAHRRQQSAGSAVQFHYRTTSRYHSLSLTKMPLWAEKSPKIILHCEALEKCSRIKKKEG